MVLRWRALVTLNGQGICMSLLAKGRTLKFTLPRMCSPRLDGNSSPSTTAAGWRCRDLRPERDIRSQRANFAAGIIRPLEQRTPVAEDVMADAAR
jgi:hypothetical protein